jgi:2-C-methyl-D-erythritol 4-phosphate cytidylyltransferase
MGASVHKQYLLLGGVPVLARTLRAIQEGDVVDDIFLVTPGEDVEYCRQEVVERYGFTKVRQIVAGGDERQHSVLNGLRALDCRDDDIVVIHDGVRPFVTADIIRRSIETALEYDGAVVAVPVKDTVKVVRQGCAVATPPRDALWLAQTPQTFRYGIIRAAHEAAANEDFLGTDDASLLERLGRRVHIVIGDYRNTKITTPDDLEMAEAYMTLTKHES